MDLRKMPVGPDHPMEEKLRWARYIHQCFSDRILCDDTAVQLLEKYRASIERSWQAMEETGVVKECTACATEDGGSCCGSGIENKFDVMNLLINLLMGVELPSRPWDPTGCWFLGERGCRIRARHVICVNFICRRLYEAIGPEEIKKVQAAMEEETENAFVLEEYLKLWITRNVGRQDCNP